MADNAQRNSIIGTVLTLTAFAVSMSVVPPLITTIANQIGADYDKFGYIITLQFFSFFLAGISGGWIGERFNLNSRKLVSTGLLILFVTLLGGATLKSLSHFMIWAIPLGFGGGLVETFGSVMISDHEKPNSSKLMNLSQVFFCIGAIVAPLIVSLFLNLHISWQVIFIIFSGFILLIFFIFLLLTRREVLAEPRPELKETSKTPLLKDKMFYLLAAMLLIYVTFESILGCWLPVYFENGLTCPARTAALRLSIFWLGVISGRLAVTVLPSRLSLWPAMLSGAILMCVGSAFASLSLTPGAVTVLVFFVGAGAGPLWPTTVAICHVIRNRTKFTSAVIAFGAIGVVIGSLTGGLILKYLGFRLFFPTIVFGSLLLIIVSYVSKKCSEQ